MSFIKTPFSVAVWGVKVLANTAFYTLAAYGAINMAIQTYNAINYIKSLKPETEIRQTVETKLKEYAIESLRGNPKTESIDSIVSPRIGPVAEERPETKYSRERRLLEELKKDPEFTRDYADWIKR